MAEIKKTKPPRINKDESIANLIPADEIHLHLKNAKGWLENDDPFFDDIDRIIQDRRKHVPRVLKGTSAE